MARGSSRRVRQVLTFLFVSFVSTCGASSLKRPEFLSVSVVSVRNFSRDGTDLAEIEFQVRGRGLFEGMPIKATKTKAPRNSVCGEDLTNYTVREVWTRPTSAVYVLVIPKRVKGTVYLCLPREQDTVYLGGKTFETLGDATPRWLHQGDSVSITSLDNSQDMLKNSFLPQPESLLKRGPRDAPSKPKIYGIRLEAGEIDEDTGIPKMVAKSSYTLRLFGDNLSNQTLVTFTENQGKPGGGCVVSTGGIFPVNTVVNGNESTNTVDVTVALPLPLKSEFFYICVSEGKISDLSNVSFIHQGNDRWLMVKTYEKMVPLWAAILIICVCLCFSALFSGLNLGLMSLDRTELKILCNTGTPKERQYAKAIQPVRNHGNYLLCSILLGNVFVNSIFTILLDGLTSGLIAVVFSTLSIVMFGEITPQAICSRHGLAVGAKTIYITKMVMLLTAPLAWPISKILDKILGEEIGNVYNRERLKELVKVTTGENDLDRDEVNIISGALELRKKTVSEVMTKIEDVFMLSYDAILDFETVSEIMKSGFSRIPVYEENRNNIVTMLYIKDLAFVDPDDNTPLKTLCQFYQNPCNFVFEDVTLDVMFKMFKEGNQGHMAFVHRVNSEGEGDPFYETIGLITLEDVIEELIQAEIMDETDVFTDNRSKRRRNADRYKQDFTIFAERKGESKVHVSPQLTLATYQYLSTSVEPFKNSSISETILRRLLKQEVWFHIKKTKDWRNDPTTLIYQQGKPADYFVLIVEGRVEVTVGRENLMFESGPFTYFGIQALTQNVGLVDSPSAPSTLGSLQSLNMDALLRHTFQPDYSVRAVSDLLYLKIKRSVYFAAKRATLMEQSKKDIPGGEQFDDEVEKLLHSLEDDSSMGRRTPEAKQEVQHEPQLNGPLSQNSTSKNASPHSMSSPTSPQQARGDNPALTKKPSFAEDGHIAKDLKVKEEEISLLPKQ